MTMKEYTNTFSVSHLSASSRSYLNPEALMLDIETTGLSAAHHFIYCIGCSWVQEDFVTIKLFFAENEQEEPQILALFADLVKSFSEIITFNGTTFDLPFLRKRFSHHQMQDPMNEKCFPDLCREARKLKSFLGLSGCTQKALEEFLGIYREDPYSGKELIRIYQEYSKHPTRKIYDLLILHNYEDVKGMYDLLALLSYRDFTDGMFEIMQTIPEKENEHWYMNFILAPAHPFPQSARLFRDNWQLILDTDRAILRLPVYHGILRHYFRDYKNYYYLPEEHTVVHKSIGSYVDPDHRERAKKENCFLEKDCVYLKADFPSDHNYYQQDFNDRNSYLELSGFHPEENPDFSLPKDQYADFCNFLMLFVKMNVFSKR